MKKNDFSKIRNLNDLENAKRLLKKKMKLRKRLMDIHINQLGKDMNGQYLLNHTLKSFGVNNPFVKLVPNILKNSLNRSQKSLLGAVASAIATGVVSFFVFNAGKGKNKSSADET